MKRRKLPFKVEVDSGNDWIESLTSSLNAQVHVNSCKSCRAVGQDQKSGYWLFPRETTFIEFIMQYGYHNPMLDIFEYKVLSYIAILMKRRVFYALCVLMQ